MKKTLLITFTLILAFSCGLRTNNSSSESEVKLAGEDNASESESEFEFGVDSRSEVMDEEEQVSAAIKPVDKEKDEFVSSSKVAEDESISKPEEPSYSEFKVKDQKIAAAEVIKEEIKEVKIETPITPLAITVDPKLKNKNLAFGDEYVEYQVQKGDTLMMIGFKLFGDYRYWKELKEWNSKVRSQDLAAGTIIRYKNINNNNFRWSPNGLPHLVKKGEYLGSISMDRYGTSKKWKEIFENNRPLLRDPNLIFAGFTIYYVPDKRGVASEK